MKNWTKEELNQLTKEKYYKLTPEEQTKVKVDSLKYIISNEEPKDKKQALLKLIREVHEE